MSKRIKANEANLIKALRATAKAHKVLFKDWRKNDGQVALNSESVPVCADVRSIVEAFCTNPFAITEAGFGYTTIYTDFAEYREEVDIVKLTFSLPYGEVDKIKW